MAEKIVVVGSTNVDFVMRLGHLPTAGETVGGGRFSQQFGGKGANTAVAAARTGPAHKTVLLTALGDDLYGPALLEAFRRDRIDDSHVLVKKSVPTGSAVILVGDNAENLIGVAPGANHALTAADIDQHAAVLRSASIVLVQLEVPPEAVRRVLSVCETAGMPVLVNYAPTSEAVVRGLPVSGQMTAVVVNKSEAAVLTGMAVEDAAAAGVAAERIVAQGPRLAVVTLGSEGSVIRGREATGAPIALSVPAFAVQAVDTTGAGDTFCGAFAVALMDGRQLAEAMRFASAAAALTCTRVGAQSAVPTRAEVDALLARK